MRIFQAVGAAMLMANSAAILTDAFPSDQRGLALGVNQAAAFSGSFIGLILGGVLAPINWRLIFLVSVPVGILGTVLRLSQVAGAGPAAASGASTGPGTSPSALGLVLDHGGHHLWDRALRDVQHGLGEPARARGHRASASS